MEIDGLDLGHGKERITLVTSVESSPNLIVLFMYQMVMCTLIHYAVSFPTLIYWYSTLFWVFKTHSDIIWSLLCDWWSLYGCFIEFISFHDLLLTPKQFALVKRQPNCTYRCRCYGALDAKTWGPLTVCNSTSSQCQNLFYITLH